MYKFSAYYPKLLHITTSSETEGSTVIGYTFVNGIQYRTKIFESNEISIQIEKCVQC